MTDHISELADFGWNTFFASQLDDDDSVAAVPVRVMTVHRSGIEVAGPGVNTTLAPFKTTIDDEETVATVGDWLLLDPHTLRAQRLLKRKSLLKRKAKGSSRRPQLIAANVDTLFIVSSCNQDFNTARLERYLALASEAEVTPVVVLTKADLTDEPEVFIREAAQLLPGLLVEVLDARSVQDVARLSPWCARGQTVAFVGSSGVGKSTLVNTLAGAEVAATGAIRDDDAKGRHTTTGRALHRLPGGGWLLDMPGMRELQLTEVASGIEDVFADVVDLVAACRFRDCGHDSEPGCAVRVAIEAGTLDEDRLRRWQKLAAEEAHNTESMAERRARGRVFSKMVKGSVKHKQSRKDE